MSISLFSRLPFTGRMLPLGSSLALSDARGAIIVRNRVLAVWRDYDLQLAVRYRDGRVVYVGAVQPDEVLRTAEGAVEHSGDIRLFSALFWRGERAKIMWHPDIESIALCSYSIHENYAGSFRGNHVQAAIGRGNQVVRLQPKSLSDNPLVYTVCFGQLLFGQDGLVRIRNEVLHSAPNSERRMGFDNEGRVVPDAGPENTRKY